MSYSHPSQLLRFALLGDAAVSGATGLLLVFAGGAVAPLLGLPVALLQYAGLSLLPFAAIVAYVGTRPSIARPAVIAIAAANVLWAVDSVALLLTGWVTPTAMGQAFVIAQAIGVAGFAVLQYLGLQRSPAAA